MSNERGPTASSREPIAKSHELRARPVMAVTLGDPGGIGPEVVAKALADPEVRRMARWRVYGPRGALVAAGWDGAGAEVVDYPGGPWKAEATKEGGEVSFRCVEDAVAAAKLPAGEPGRVEGVVTGPISKAAWAMAGHGEFPGHTEMFAARLGVERFGMMFVTPRLRVILATAHVPLMQVAGTLTRKGIVRAVELGGEACTKLGVERPRIAVCGLNPHAGEGGLLGTEDVGMIAQAIGEAREKGWDVSGPWPGDTVFNAAVGGKFDLVVAMYHDQGLIPVKLLDRDRAVNVTVGLPIVRTSPDHGTAFDIAGQGVADAGSMREAMGLGVRMVRGEVATETRRARS